MSEASSEDETTSVFLEEPLLGVGLVMLFTTPLAEWFSGGIGFFGIPVALIWGVGAFVVMGVPIYRMGREIHPPPE